MLARRAVLVVWSHVAHCKQEQNNNQTTDEETRTYTQTQRGETNRPNVRQMLLMSTSPFFSEYESVLSVRVNQLRTNKRRKWLTNTWVNSKRMNKGHRTRKHNYRRTSTPLFEVSHDLSFLCQPAFLLQHTPAHNTHKTHEFVHELQTAMTYSFAQ